MSQLTLVDCAPQADDFLRDVLDGLTDEPKRLPCKYFYDERGSQLFEQICDLPEYYPTRTEIGILQKYGPEIADAIGPKCAVIEYGSGSGLKTETLLAHLHEPNAYFPVDISREHLQQSAAAIDEKFPGLAVIPVCADFTQPFELPTELVNGSRKIAYFSGSTIGNFEIDEAIDLLEGMASLCGPSGGMLIGVDLVKARHVLEAAYDDSDGVTSKFNKNVLRRANADLDADFDLGEFEHRAIFNEADSRVEMHLVSRREQEVTIAGRSIHFDAGETIHTENSHKYTLASFAEIAAQAGLRVEQVWTDEREYFSVQYLRVGG